MFLVPDTANHLHKASNASGLEIRIMLDRYSPELMAVAETYRCWAAS